MSYDLILARLENLRATMGGDNTKVRAALIRIGITLERDTKMAISRNKMTKSGALLNSIRYELAHGNGTETLTMGSFGIKYAAINEYGGKMTKEQIDAMFESFKGRRKRAGKGVVRVFKDGSGYHKARPYIAALEDHMDYILEQLREAYSV